MASTPPIPPVTEIDLLLFSDIVDNARTDHEQGLTTGLVATSNDGQPDLALKGSLMVWDKDHLAWWERSKRETPRGVGGESARRDPRSEPDTGAPRAPLLRNGAGR